MILTYFNMLCNHVFSMIFWCFLGSWFYWGHINLWWWTNASTTVLLAPDTKSEPDWSCGDLLASSQVSLISPVTFWNVLAKRNVMNCCLALTPKKSQALRLRRVLLTHVLFVSEWRPLCSIYVDRRWWLGYVGVPISWLKPVAKQLCCETLVGVHHAAKNSEKNVGCQHHTSWNVLENLSTMCLVYLCLFHSQLYLFNYMEWVDVAWCSIMLHHLWAPTSVRLQTMCWNMHYVGSSLKQECLIVLNGPSPKCWSFSPPLSAWLWAVNWALSSWNFGTTCRPSNPFFPRQWLSVFSMEVCHREPRTRGMTSFIPTGCWSPLATGWRWLPCSSACHLPV